ncbi:ankyrin repeat-containing protein [Fusarium heterosporum]|uniref:Ankyrin repeat-containing protein n=1 Tax=Fusarium heterosporum TaxID=42747 RepID=A0A8H5TNW8_FUSHE|nr:ankyrin repeat-containing protein [Fusarium heterosporum]
MKRRQPQLSDYTIGWVCALPIELAAAQEMLDDEHMELPHDDIEDTNLYTLGRIGHHNVVVVCLPSGQIGNNCAAVIATQMKSRFTSIRFGLMVGIGGGVPSDKADIRLGDIVISQPDSQHGGVVQYDSGKSTPSGFQRTGTLNAPPTVLLNVLSKFRANAFRDRNDIEKHLSQITKSSTFNRDDLEPDILFEASYNHVQGENCDMCRLQRQIHRKPRKDETPQVHFGTLASGNRVMRDGIMRDRVSNELGGVLCFEMEAAGLMNSFPCLVIRGICDYADSHKNKTWQPYAAATAAACAKEILLMTPTTEKPKFRRKTNNKDIKEMQEKLTDSMDMDSAGAFLSMLSPTLDSQQKIHMPSFGAKRFHWVFRNIDFKTWVSSKVSQTLWISGPAEFNLKGIVPHIAKMQTHQASGDHKYGIHISCTESTDFRQLVHSLLHRVITNSTSGVLAALQIFLKSLLSYYYEDTAARYMESTNNIVYFSPLDHLEDMLSKMLRLQDNYLRSALSRLIGHEGETINFIIIDGLEYIQETGHGFFQSLRTLIGQIPIEMPKIKILVVGQLRPRNDPALEGLVRISYDRERQACLNSLRFDNTRVNKISSEYEGSCDWLWSHPNFLEWSASRNSRLLLIEGKPGSGKSTITKCFHKEAPKHIRGLKASIVASFFYSYREGELQRSHKNMLRSILYDILLQDDTFFYHKAQEIYRRQQGKDWTYESLKHVFRSLATHEQSKEVCLVIDAVDESEEADRRNILTILSELCSNSSSCIIKAFVASRPINELKLRRCTALSFIKLQDETRDAIALFARSFLDDLDMARVYDKAVDYILEHAQGVFLWVKLVGEELLAFQESGCSQEEVFTSLQSLPTELEDYYEHMLLKMNKREKEVRDTIKMFSFVLYGQRPLAVMEVLHALSVLDCQSSNFVPASDYIEKHLPTERRIWFCGGNFLETARQDEQEVVQVMHQTAREFFLSPHGSVANSNFKISEHDAHSGIARTCLQYLMLCATETAELSSFPDVKCWTINHHLAFARFLEAKPLAVYALEFSRHHMDASQDREDIGELISQFTSNLGAHGAIHFFEKWIKKNLGQKVIESHERQAAIYFRDQVLLAAAKYGLSNAVRMLLIAGADVNAKDHGKTPLSWAAWRGHITVVKALIIWPGVELYVVDYSNETPLSLAKSSGHKKVVELLKPTYVPATL